MNYNGGQWEKNADIEDNTNTTKEKSESRWDVCVSEIYRLFNSLHGGSKRSEKIDHFNTVFIRMWAIRRIESIYIFRLQTQLERRYRAASVIQIYLRRSRIVRNSIFTRGLHRTPDYIYPYLARSRKIQISRFVSRHFCWFLSAFTLACQLFQKFVRTPRFSFSQPQLCPDAQT